MRLPSLIGHVLEVYQLFYDDPSTPADAVIRSFFYDRKYLGAKDRRFIADGYFGVIKNRWRLEALVKDARKNEDEKKKNEEKKHENENRNELPNSLVIAAYYIAVQGTPPKEMVEAMSEIRGAAHYPPEIYWHIADRGIEIARFAAMETVARIALAYSFPEWFVAAMIADYGEEQIETILLALNEEAPTTLRANTLVVASREVLAEELLVEETETRPSELVPDALILPKRINVMSSKAHKRGAFEIQDEASQMVAPMAQIKGSMRVLDACAGAGGKTLHLAALLRNRGELYSTDIDPWKLEELKKRVKRSTAQNVRIVKPDQYASILGKGKDGYFDVVLLDVPCTGTGTVRRNPGIKWILTEQMLSELVEKQRAIIAENLRFVKSGGALLYATCSLLHAECEDQVEWILSEYPSEFTVEQTLRTRPDMGGCDGFFAARLRRK